MITLAEIASELMNRVSGLTEDQADMYTYPAVDHYSMYNPYLLVDTLSLEIDVVSYDPPSGCIGVERIEWWPFGEKSLASDLEQFPDTVILSDSLRIFKRWKDFDLFRCRWRLEGSKLIIFPKPTADEDVEIVYRMVHGYASSSGGFETIPTEDKFILINCALAEYLSIRQMQNATLPDFSEGMTSIRRGNIGRSIEMAVEHLHKPLLLKYG